MKAVISRNDLLGGIGRAAAALPQRATPQQVLQNILLDFSSESNTLRATATDLEIAILVDVPGKLQELGGLTLPGRKLLEGLRELPEGDVTLVVTEKNALTIKAGKARQTLRGTGREDYPNLPLTSGANGRVTLQIPVVSGCKIDSPVLREAIRKTIVAASHDETRTFLTGAHLSVGPKHSRLVATDGHRLAVCDFELAAKAKGEIGIIIPLRILAELSSSLPDKGEVAIEVGDSALLFHSTAGTYYSRLIAEKFPDYEKIIPKASENRLTMKRGEFINALRCVSPFTNTRTNAVLLSVKSDKIVVSAESPEFGEGQSEVEADVKGGAMELSFNGLYLMDGLKVLTGEELTFELGAKQAPAVLTTPEDKGYKYILMPLRP